MLYWKTFVAMCTTVWVLLIANIAVIALGIFGVIKIGAGLWLCVGFCTAIFAMASFICYFIMDVEVKERKEQKDGRARNIERE